MLNILTGFTLIVFYYLYKIRVDVQILWKLLDMESKAVSLREMTTFYGLASGSAVGITPELGLLR